MEINEKISKKAIAYEKIKEAIIKNELAPNQVLIERNLCEELKISRTPIRAALLQLEKEDLVKSIPNRGIFVSEIRLKDIIEIYEFREALDTLAFKLSLNLLKERLGEELLECANQQKSIIERIEKTKQWEEFFVLDSQFHRIYVERCNNTRVINAFNTLFDQIARFSFSTYGDIERATKSMEEHLLIAQKVIDNDIELALKILSNHIKGIKEYYINKIISNGNI